MTQKSPRPPAITRIVPTASEPGEIEKIRPVRASQNLSNDRKAIRLAMRIGEVLLSSGLSANDVVVSMMRIVECYGLKKINFDVSNTAITASYYPGLSATPITAMRVARSIVIDYTLVQNIYNLYEKIRTGMSVDDALREYEGISKRPPPYPQWVATMGNAGVGAAVNLMFTTSWKIILITFLTGCLIDRLLSLMRDQKMPTFFQQIISAAIITLIAVAIGAADAAGVLFFVGVDPTLIVVGGIIMLVAGNVFVAAALDAIDEFFLTATARAFDSLMRTGGIVLGIVIVLALAKQLGMPVTISANPVALGPLPAQFIGAALTSLTCALSYYAPPSITLLSAVMGFLGWVGYTLTYQVGGGEVAANTLGGLAVALASTLLTRKTSVPGFALINAAILPLVPGLALYTGLIQMVGVTPESGSLIQGGLSFFLAVGVGLGIACGASFGTYLGRPIADQIHSVRQIQYRWMANRRTKPSADRISRSGQSK